MAKYKIDIKDSAIKEIKKLPSKDIKKILGKISALGNQPRPQNCIKLSADDKYRIRIGVYRILYEIKDNLLAVIIVKVGHRKDVYK
jgi:mRNA interferase RelE/StbE